MVELSILMPCLNEKESIEFMMKKATEALAKLKIDGEIVVADNGSSDNSVELAIANGARVCVVEEKGYGGALRGGIQFCRGKYIIMLDCDGSYDFDQLGNFMAQLRGGSDFVMGNRFKGEIKQGAMPFLHKYLGNPVLSFLAQLLFRSNISDFHCGIRAFNAAKVRELNLRCSGMEFATEMIARAEIANLKIAEVPVTLSPDLRSRPPHLKTWQDGWRHLKMMLQLSPQWLLGFPGLLLAATSIFFNLMIIVFDRIQIGSTVFSDNTFIYLNFVSIIGFQLLLFYTIAAKIGRDAGLLDDGPISRKLSGLITSGYTPFVGGFFSLLGLVVLAYGLLVWAQTGLGDLKPSQLTQMATLGGTLLVVGTEMTLVSIFIGFTDFLYVKESKYSAVYGVDSKSDRQTA